MATEVKSVTGQKLVIPEARLAFPNLFEMRSVDGGTPSFGCTLLIPKDSPIVAVVSAEEERIAKAKWDAKATAELAAIRANNRGAIKPGELKANYDGFQGMMFISCNTQKRPTVVNRDRTPLTAADGVIYAGCNVLAHIALWAQDNKYGKRINAEVTGIQFIGDGDAFGGGSPPSSADDFADLSAGTDAGSLMS